MKKEKPDSKLKIENLPNEQKRIWAKWAQNSFKNITSGHFESLKYFAKVLLLSNSGGFIASGKFLSDNTCKIYCKFLVFFPLFFFAIGLILALLSTLLMSSYFRKTQGDHHKRIFKFLNSETTLENFNSDSDPFRNFKGRIMTLCFIGSTAGFILGMISSLISGFLFIFL